MRRAGIHMRLFIAAFLLISLTTLIMDVVVVHLSRKFMHKRFEDRISFLAKYLALNSEVGILVGDRKGLDSLALNLMGEEDVVRVSIFDSEGKNLVDKNRESSGPLSEISAPVIFKRKSEENLLFSEMSTPFGNAPLQAEEFIGEVRVSYSMQSLDQLIDSISRDFIWLSVLLAALAGITFFVVSRPIVVEVKELAVVARQVGRGDRDVRARPGKIPETKSLADDFNLMLASLQKNREALDRVNREMIKQKTLAEMGKFSLMIAHEFKNPISIIKTSMDILKKDYQIDSENTLVFYIEDEIRRLDRLIEEFLMFARPIRPTFRQIDFNKMLRNLIERFELMNRNGSVSLTSSIPDIPEYGKGDADLISKAIDNIVKNAFNAVDENGNVSVSAFTENNVWTVEIADDGDGIAPEHLNKIFDPFFTTRAKGTGLGLSFSLQVVRGHHGMILAENRSGGGAVFRIILPMNASDNLLLG